MAKEKEHKRRSPGIIARLMGLDGLPPQKSTHKQYKSIENHQQRTIPYETAQTSSTFHGHRSFRKSSKEEQEFKDVFEVLDTPKVESSGYLCRGLGKTNLTEEDMAFVRQKFMEAKRLSTDEKLQHSKEFHDALEALDSNKDLFLKFLQHPDSMFTKHLQDLQSVVPEFHCGHISSMKPFNGHSDRENKGHKSKREILQKSRSGSPSHSLTRRVACDNTPESPKMVSEERKSLQPTRIVVLKPNLGKTQNILSSPSSPSDDFRTDSRLPCTMNQETDLWNKKKAHEPREISEQITWQIRTSCGKRGFMNFQSSRFRGYAGDESSSGSDTESEPELVKVTPIATFNRRNRYRSSSSRSTESSVSREAKERLSERWRLTRKSEQVGEISRSSTLAEMLAVSDGEARPANFNGVIFEGGLSKRYGSNSGLTESGEPLGISSRDGWKECIRSLTDPRSLPASSSAPGSPRTIMHHENPRDYKVMIPKDVTKRERNKAVKESSTNHKDNFFSINSRPSGKKSQSSCKTLSEISYHQCKGSNFLVDDRTFEQKLTTEAQPSFSLDVNSDAENVANAGDVKTIMSSETSNVELSASTSLNDSTSGYDGVRSQDLSGSSLTEQSCSSVPELQSPASTKEGDQPSPVSVLETSFPDDFSSGTECFESISADLHGLRMQLQLLKLESGAYEEGHMLVSSDEDADPEEYIGLTDDELMSQESQKDWKSLYLIDVLGNSRFGETDPDTFMATWHSSESPVSPSLFEELEKKYSFLTSSSRSQRKFLFDSINSELPKLFKQFADPHPWVKPTRVSPKWDVNELQETLRELIMKKDGKASKCVGEEGLERESQWLNLEEDIDVIGREIERLLTDELIAEVVISI